MEGVERRELWEHRGRSLPSCAVTPEEPAGAKARGAHS